MLLNPFSLLLVCQVNKRFRHAALEVWGSRKDKATIQNWLKRELKNFYLPLHRLSYYDRDYRTNEYTLTIPKKVVSVMHILKERSDVDFLERLLQDADLILTDFDRGRLESQPKGGQWISPTNKHTKKHYWESKFIQTHFAHTVCVAESNQVQFRELYTKDVVILWNWERNVKLEIVNQMDPEVKMFLISFLFLT